MRERARFALIGNAVTVQVRQGKAGGGGGGGGARIEGRGEQAGSGFRV